MPTFTENFDEEADKIFEYSQKAVVAMEKLKLKIHDDGSQRRRNAPEDEIVHAQFLQELRTHTPSQATPG